ncbi:hypothetical protein MGAST_28345 [Mycobacterium gastri 'Wayne']|nr:hypothetical protein MGAST_28345 [Mycobacterium gastri 'Wayne']
MVVLPYPPVDILQPSGSLLTRHRRLRRWRLLFPGVVDGLDVRFVVVGCFREGGGDSGRRGRDFGAYFVFDPDELGGALADVGGESLCLCLTRCLFCGGAAGSGVGDREVFADVEAGVVGVLDGIDDPPLGGADGSGALTR